jgi:hypothetical protein
MNFVNLFNLRIHSHASCENQNCINVEVCNWNCTKINKPIIWKIFKNAWPASVKGETILRKELLKLVPQKAKEEVSDTDIFKDISHHLPHITSQLPPPAKVTSKLEQRSTTVRTTKRKTHPSYISFTEHFSNLLYFISSLPCAREMEWKQHMTMTVLEEREEADDDEESSYTWNEIEIVL